MKSLDRTAQSIDALIQANALDAAADLVRAYPGSLVTHTGLDRVAQWCAQLGLEELLDLPKALAAAHVVREQRGSVAVREFLAVAQLANARGDEIAEFHALSAMYATGFVLWAGFREMQREYARINALFAAHGASLSPHDAIVCLPGLLAARMLFGASAIEASKVGEHVVALVHDNDLPDAMRLHAATLLMPWFEHTTSVDRLNQTHRAFAPLAAGPNITAVARVTYRSVHALATAFLYAADPAHPEYWIDSVALMDEADQTGLQWLRFLAKRTVFERASRSAKSESAPTLLDELEALLDPADPSQVLSVRFRRAALALRNHRYAESLANATICVDLARALEMPDGFALLYDDNVAAALLGLDRFDEAIAMYDRILSDALPGHRLRYQRVHALARSLQALEQCRTLSTYPDAAATSASVVKLRADLAALSELCAGSLSQPLLRIFPVHTARVAAAMFEFSIGDEALARDVLAHSLAPPEARLVTWPWHLRIRLFDGFTCEGLASSAQDAGKKGESKSAQILQYLAAHAPNSVSTQRLADALWPEAEGDRAMRSLDVALTRLRPTLPDPTLIVRHDGKISFDRRRVWCDSDAALVIVEEIRARSQLAGTTQVERVSAEPAHGWALARSALALLDIYRGPLLPDSREAFARDRADYFRSQVAGAVQIGLRAAVRLPESTMAGEIIRLSVSHGLPASLVRAVIADLASTGDNTSRRASELNDVFELARR